MQRQCWGKAEQIFNKVGKTLTLDEANAEFQAWISSQKELSGGEAAYKYIDTNGEVYRTCFYGLAK